MILIYAFSNQWGTNISTRTLIDLQSLLSSPSFLKVHRSPEEGRGSGGGFVFQKILSHPRSFFNEYVHNKLYSTIIGLGDFYYPFDKIRIESQAQNLYGRHSIIPHAPRIIDLDIPLFDHLDSSQFVITHNMGSYNCNWIAYQIQSYINQKNLTCYHLFFHLPPKNNSTDFAKSIANLLNDSQVLQ